MTNDKNPDQYLLRSEEISEFKGIVKTHFLNNQARRINKSLGDLTGITGFGFHIIEIEPGCYSTEKHQHYYEDECLYILEGEAEATIGEDVFSVKAGDFIGYRASGLAHTLKNSGSAILKCIVVGERLDHDVADYPDLNKRIYRNRGMANNLVDIDQVSEPIAGKKA